MRIGAAEAPPLLFVAPLFEEMNRTRALIAGTMRRLAARGHGCWLADLPGTGESPRPLAEAGWALWRSAIAAAADHVAEAAGRRAVTVAIRGGCLLDDAAAGPAAWRLAPVAGAALARDLDRAGAIGGAPWGGHEAVMAMRDDLAAAVPAPLPARVARLESDPAPADARIAGAPPWRRAEPDAAPELSIAMVDDIGIFLSSCARS